MVREPIRRRVLCIVNGGMAVASARERVLKYLPALERLGIRSRVLVAGAVSGRWTYWRTLLRALAAADVVLLQRVPLSAAERAVIRASRRPVVFDVDDAVWTRVDPGKDGAAVPSPREAAFFATMKLARLVRTGNEELARIPERLGLRTVLAPTCVPPAAPEPPARKRPFTVGWLGHSSNFRYFGECREALQRFLAARPGSRLRVMADRAPELPGAEFVPWRLEDESGFLDSLDVGIMPLKDTPHARGKCAFKLLRYMAHGIPVVCSPVGANTRVVRGGRTGFFARTQNEWRNLLERLAQDIPGRRQMGVAARESITGRFDFETGLKSLRRDLLAPPPPDGTTRRKRVAMFLYNHPPAGGSGAVRNAAMARRLRRRGWDPVIVTAQRIPGYFVDGTIPHLRPSALVDAPSPGRIPIGSLRRALEIPDRAWPWALAALPSALRAARGASVIYSSSPPESAHVLARMVKRLTRKPWLADLRNEWADNPARTMTPRERDRHRRWEIATLRAADRLTTLSPHHTRLLKRIHPAPHRVSTLWTGLDEIEIRPLRIPRPDGPAKILFAGTFYGIQRPDPFLDALDHLPDGEIDFHVLGNAWEFTPLLRRSGARILGRVSRKKALREMQGADFLLVTLTAEAGNVVPGKIFEYAASGRPIIALVPEDGEVAAWIRETGTGWVIPCAPVERAAEGLNTILRNWRKGTLSLDVNPAALERYADARIADELDRLLREVTGIPPEMKP